MTNHKLLQYIKEEKIFLQIPVLNRFGNQIAVLKPLVISNLHDHEIIKKLTDWRNLYSSSFFSQFKTTNERTYKWLKDDVLPDPGRLFFLIYFENRMIGYIAIKNLSTDNVESDNVLRGETGGGMELMFYVLFSEYNWIFNELKVRTITAGILNSNRLVKILAKKLGYEFVNEIPVILEKTSEGKFFKALLDKKVTPDDYIQNLILTKEKFLTVNRNQDINFL